MFFKARKVSNLPSTRTLANAALEDYIGPVYRIEGQIKALRAEYQQRGEWNETIAALEAFLANWQFPTEDPLY